MTTTTATVINRHGIAWRITAELAAIRPEDRAIIEDAVRAFAAAIEGSTAHEVEVTVPDHTALAELA